MKEDILKSIQSMIKTNDPEKKAKGDISQDVKSMMSALNAYPSSDKIDDDQVIETPNEDRLNEFDDVIDGLNEENNNNDTSEEDNDDDPSEEDSDDDTSEEDSANSSGDGAIQDILASIEKAVKKQSTFDYDDHNMLDTQEYSVDKASKNKSEHSLDNKIKADLEEIVSDKSKDAIDTALSNLNHVIHNYKILKYVSDEQLHELMINSMKPYLSEWINKHLPEVVNRVVEQEIKKLTEKWSSE